VMAKVFKEIGIKTDELASQIEKANDYRNV
jgi:hypothetical protein